MTRLLSNLSTPTFAFAHCRPGAGRDDVALHARAGGHVHRRRARAGPLCARARPRRWRPHAARGRAARGVGCAVLWFGLSACTAAALLSRGAVGTRAGRVPPVAALREVSGALRWCCRRACHVAAAWAAARAAGARNARACRAAESCSRWAAERACSAHALALGSPSLPLQPRWLPPCPTAPTSLGWPLTHAPLPPLAPSLNIAAAVAAAVANRAYNSGVATELPRPHDLVAQAKAWMYNPRWVESGVGSIIEAVLC